jgi:hypothetical protein
MYLTRLDRHISDDVQKAIEDNSTFKVFLIRFGLHNMQEYRSFEDRDKSICIEEYLKEKLAKDPDWLDSIISFYEY